MGFQASKTLHKRVGFGGGKKGSPAPPARKAKGGAHLALWGWFELGLPFYPCQQGRAREANWGTRAHRWKKLPGATKTKGHAFPPIRLTNKGGLRAELQKSPKKDHNV